MKVRVLYFATARDLADRKSEDVTIREGASVKDLSAALIQLHPGLGNLAGSARYSVNLELAEDGVRLHDGDEVGVLPPVAGG